MGFFNGSYFQFQKVVLQPRLCPRKNKLFCTFPMNESLFILLRGTKAHKKGIDESLKLAKNTFGLMKKSEIWVVDKTLRNCANFINFDNCTYEPLHEEQNILVPGVSTGNQPAKEDLGKKVSEGFSTALSSF